MSVRYGDVVESLRASYDGGAVAREGVAKDGWKVAERAAFADRLRAEGCARLLEIGAGTGQDGLFFQERGLDVVVTDLSPAMVEHCRAKGLDAHVRDFLRLDFPPGSFDAVYALNCLLHVPNADLPEVLETIRRMLRPGGLFFLGVYGGTAGEGVMADDLHVQPRFFSWRTDEQIQAYAAASFEVEDFHVVAVGEYAFQSLTLRRAR